jgi:hypothetical protein
VVKAYFASASMEPLSFKFEKKRKTEKKSLLPPFNPGWMAPYRTNLK